MIRRALALLGALAAFVVGTLLGVRRAHAVRALSRAGVADPERTASAMYRHLGRGLAELVWLSLRPRAELELDIVGQAELDAALAPGKGAVLCVAHTGNWDWAACAAAAHYPLTVVTKHLSIGVLDRVWQRTRARRGVRLVAAGGAARAAARALARGELVAMMVDQAPERERATTVAPFLGAPARVDSVARARRRAVRRAAGGGVSATHRGRPSPSRHCRRPRAAPRRRRPRAAPRRRRPRAAPRRRRPRAAPRRPPRRPAPPPPPRRPAPPPPRAAPRRRRPRAAPRRAPRVGRHCHARRHASPRRLRP